MLGHLKHMVRWTWNRVQAPPPVPPGVEWGYSRVPPYGHYLDGYNVFGPYKRPIVDATGGGTLNARQLAPYAGQIVVTQTIKPVSITGDGSELTGQFQVLGLVDVSSNNATQ